MSELPRIVVLDGYTLNPGDNPWAPIQVLGRCTIHDRTPPELTLQRAREGEIVFINVFTPHVAWASVAARRRLMSAVAQNVASFLAGAPQNVVNAHWLLPRPLSAPGPALQVPMLIPGAQQHSRERDR